MPGTGSGSFEKAAMFLDRLGLRPHGRCLGVCPGMLQKSLESFPAGPTFGNSLRPFLPVLDLLDKLVFPFEDRLELIVADPLGQVAQVSQVRSPGQWRLSPRQLTKRLHAVKEPGGALRFLAWLHVQPDVVENLPKLDQLGCGENDVLDSETRRCRGSSGRAWSLARESWPAFA